MTPIEQQVTLLKTIADPTRLRILGLLAGAGHSGADLARALDLTPATVSHHMSKLTEVGIVSVTPDGKRRIYRLNDALLGQLGATDDPTRIGEPTASEVVRDPQHERHVRIFFDGPRLRSIPAKRKARVSVLLELLTRFEPGRRYAEAEVNDVLRTAHDDVAYLRRELVDYRYLEREDGVYRVSEKAP